MKPLFFSVLYIVSNTDRIKIKIPINVTNKKYLLRQKKLIVFSAMQCNDVNFIIFF